MKIFFSFFSIICLSFVFSDRQTYFQTENPVFTLDSQTPFDTENYLSTIFIDRPIYSQTENSIFIGPKTFLVLGRQSVYKHPVTRVLKEID